MKIISEFYLATLSIILVGVPLLFYLKLNEPHFYTYNIVIYGDSIDATMLAYYMDNQIAKSLAKYENIIRFNITLISSPQNQVEEKRGEIDKRIFSFCGVEREWMAMLENTNLKYNIKQYGIYFGEILEKVDKNQFNIYSTQTSLLTSVGQYGLSNYAARNFFQTFAEAINQTSKSKNKYKKQRLEELSTSNIIKSYFPNNIEEDSLKYFSEKLGLDQKYIQNFIFPVIWGNYLHEANSLSTLFKLLPIYCHKKPQIGKSLVLFEDPKKIKEKMLSRISQVKMNVISNRILQTYTIVKDPHNDKKKYVNTILSQKKLNLQDENESIARNDTFRTYIQSDILFIFEDIDSTTTVKQFSYYKTIVDGKIKNDESYEEFFTIYMKIKPRKKQDGKEEPKKDKIDNKFSAKSYQFNPIYSITRICAYNCKGYENSVYILISKHKLSSSKHLQMFESHNIIYFKKFFLDKSQMPTNKKLQQNENVFKIYDIDSISDSYEVQLNLVKEITTSFVDKIKRQYLA